MSVYNGVRMRVATNTQKLLLEAARVVAGERLTDAFGHVSVRTSPTELVITPPVPLSLLSADHELAALTISSGELPAGAPKEAWLHLAIAEGRPDVGAICRAQPPSVAALVAADLPVLALNGHASFLGDEVPVHGDSRLIRDLDSARRVSTALGSSNAVILRGNGAVTCGPDLPSAVAMMWVLEKTAQLNLLSRSAGTVSALPSDEQEWWRERASELLPRIYTYLAKTNNKDTT